MNAATVGLQTRVLVVEDHPPFLDFIAASIRQNPNLQVVGEVQDGLDAVEQAETLQPDIILLDIRLPGLNGIDAAHQIRELAPGAKIIFLTQECSGEVVREAFDLGAWGYVIKTKAGRELPLAINTVLQGKKFLGTGLDA